VGKELFVGFIIDFFYRLIPEYPGGQQPQLHFLFIAGENIDDKLLIFSFISGSFIQKFNRFNCYKKYKHF